MKQITTWPLIHTDISCRWCILFLAVAPVTQSRRLVSKLRGYLVLMRNTQVIDVKHSGLRWDEQSLDGVSSPLSAASPSVFFFLSQYFSLPLLHPTADSVALEVQEPFSVSKQNNLLCGCKAFQLKEAFITNLKTVFDFEGFLSFNISFAFCALSCYVPP